MYSFTLEPASAADYLQGNWYVSTWPESRFVGHLIAACVRNSTRHNLFNRQYTQYPQGSEPLTREIGDVVSLRNLLSDTFGISLASLEDLDSRLLTLFQTEVSA